MKSIRQIPITHPTHEFLDAQLEESNKVLSMISRMNDLWDGRGFDYGTWKVPIPVCSSNMKSWQTIVYEISSFKDYEEARGKYEESCQIVRSGEQK